MSDLDPIRDPRAIESLSDEGLAYIWVVGAFITSIFVWILFRNVKVPPDLIKIDQRLLQSMTLALYYFCWVAGTKFDCKTQKWVYLVDPTSKHYPVSSVIVVIALALVAVGLLSTRDEAYKFALFLAALLIVNIIAWLHLLTRILPIIKASAKRYKELENFFGLERLYIVTHYINGRWQWFRFFGMTIIAAALLVISLSENTRRQLAQLVMGAFSINAEVTYQLLPELTFLAFVVFAEGWIWVERIRTRFTMKVLYALEDYYLLNPDLAKTKQLKEHWAIEDHLKWWKTIRRGLRLSSRNRRRGRRTGDALSES